MNGLYTMLGPQGFGTYRVEDGVATREMVPPEAVLTPGFVDIHCHGAFGIDFMSATRDDMLTLVNRLSAEGYEGFLPTTITASPDQISAALDNLPEHDAVWGFHLEGPFISPKYPGAQPPEAIILPPDGPSDWDRILDDPRLRVITLAPEVPRCLELILRLRKRGVVVSMGHTDATYDEARFGYEFGAMHTTHTFNAMRPLHHREAGTVGYALSNDDLFCELIYDRIHVCPDAAALLLKVKPQDKVIAVSDSTAATGLPKGTRLDMWGHPGVVGIGDVRLEANDALAGSAISLHQAFQNLAEDFGLETAIRCCCHNPRLALPERIVPKVYVEWSLDLKLKAVHRTEISFPV